MTIRVPGLLILIIAGLSGACTQSSFSSKKTNDGGQSAPSDLQEKREESGKTSDESEGVPGYLVDPASITGTYGADTQSLAITIKGAPGSVASGVTGVKPDALWVVVWQIPTDVLTRFVGGDKKALATARRIGAARVGANGTFTTSLTDVPAEGHLIVSVEATDAPTAPRALKYQGKFTAASRGTNSTESFRGIAVGEPLANSMSALLATVPDESREFVTTCLTKLYGANSSGANLARYRRIGDDADSVTIIGYAFTDPASEQRELVHLRFDATNVGGLLINLNNKNATYCLEIETVNLSASTINVQCQAKFDDSGVSAVNKVGIVVNRTGC